MVIPAHLLFFLLQNPGLLCKQAFAGCSMLKTCVSQASPVLPKFHTLDKSLDLQLASLSCVSLARWCLMQAEDLPVAPVVIPGSMSVSVAHTPRTVRIQIGSEAPPGGGRRSQDASDASFSTRHTPMSARIKRSSSVLLAA